MDTWIHRGPRGYTLEQMEGVKELEENLCTLNRFDAFTNESRVTLEIEGTWTEIKKLLESPLFNDVWEIRQ